ncbi:TrbL/VirB6 plasmid conjugal transfer protein [Saccharolobus shibatae B12]|uniref:TrbL/VirB6 plasmid conjugal transfer protein n=1 Tax=Saccharolobus shibatae (strain ATCC 51178 / DSM 5389 / JCM 8931 / NBRC 15437 / B12) TaxID=523848 RepID=A0A8F5GUG7_SACSH|nr:hypothetical protein [Saccharolobus shibatae]QXJ27120.1 TrbL/VirB6 plasmid conjugal transfer protein [Saccharolobus shibatae B12]QXJ30013.1 TrbL/VirB6 plasmid conjugal transfer protein [Saccharolobus shibatae B12]
MKEVKVKIFLAVFLFPALILSNSLLVMAATGSSNPQLATFLSYLAALIELMALIAIRKDFTYGLTLMAAGAIVAVLTAQYTSNNGTITALNNGVLTVYVNVYQYYPGGAFGIGAHWNYAPDNVFDPGQPAYIVVVVSPYFGQANVNITIYCPSGSVDPIVNAPFYQTFNAGHGKTFTGYIVEFIPETGRYDIVVTASYVDGNTIYYGTGETAFVAEPGSIGSFFISALQALSSYFISGVGSVVPGLNSGIASSISSLIYVPTLEGNSASNVGTLAYNFFNNVFMPFATTYVPLFLTATVGINAFLGNYGDFYDLLRDLIYKVGVYWIFTSAGVIIWDQSAQVLNYLASQILPSTYIQMLASDVAGLLTTTGALFGLATASNVFGDALSQAFTFMLELTIAIFMAGLIRQVLLLTLAALIPFLAALWVFEWTRRFVDIIVEVGLAFVISGVVDALILRFIIAYSGGWLWLMGPIFIFTWVMMGLGVARAAGAARGAASFASHAVGSASAETTQRTVSAASEAKERLQNYMSERKENKAARQTIEAIAPQLTPNLGSTKPKEIVGLAKDSDFYTKYDEAKQRLDKAAKEAAGLGVSKDELIRLAAINDEKQLDKELQKYTPQQRAAINEYLDANKEVEKYKAAEYLRNVQAGLASLNLRGVKVDPWKVQEAAESLPPNTSLKDAQKMMGTELFYQYLVLQNLQNNAALGMKPREAADRAYVDANMYYFFSKLNP